MAEMVWVKDQYDEDAAPMRVTLEKFEKSLGARGFRLCDPPERAPTAGESKADPAEVRRKEIIANRKAASSESVSDPVNVRHEEMIANREKAEAAPDPAAVRKKEMIANRKKASPASVAPAEKRRKTLAAERRAKAYTSKGVTNVTGSSADVTMSTANPSLNDGDDSEGGVSAMVGSGDDGGPKSTSATRQAKRAKKSTPKED